VSLSALLVGTASHTRGLPAMPQAHANIVDLSDALTGRFAIQRIVDPTSAVTVLDRLHAAARSRSELLLFYFAGHGLRDERDRLCLALPGSVDTPADASRTSLPASAVFEVLRGAAVRHRVVVLDCCYSGLALDEPAAADLHLLTATNRTTKARFEPGQRNTEFTGELLRTLAEGVPDGPSGLNLGLVYRRLNVVLRGRSLPAPKQRAVDLSADLSIAANPAYGTATTPEGLHIRAHFADQVGRVGRAAQAADLFAGIVADAPEVVSYRHAHASWIGQAGDASRAAALLAELATELSAGAELDAVLASLAHWRAIAAVPLGDTRVPPRVAEGA